MNYKTKDAFRDYFVNANPPIAYRFIMRLTERKFTLAELRLCLSQCARNLPARYHHPAIRKMKYLQRRSVRHLLYRFPKPAFVEAVYMPSERRQTVCISTQAGCAVDFQFCLTAQLGLIRNLSAGEIIA